jgi:hypothetical protein
MQIWYNDSLKAFNGLDSLKSIGGSCIIGSNGELYNLDGLENLKTVGFGLLISNEKLNDITALKSVNSIGSTLDVNHSSGLYSLEGLENILPASIQGLSIHDNINLSTCDLKSICEYLKSPTGEVQITNNAPGCNSQEEVVAACADNSIDYKEQDNLISIHPNPANSIVSIICAPELFIDGASIYDQYGQKVLERNHFMEYIDVSHLHDGMYFLKLSSYKGTFIRKLVIERN